MNQGLVSVIIPVYNRKLLLEECVRSVTSQSYQNTQILIIDDGSTDGTGEKCLELAKHDHRIQLLTGTHGGVSAARNIGLENATGEYVFFVDSDDVIHPRLLEALVSGLQNTDAGIAATGIITFNEKNRCRVEELRNRNGQGAIEYHDNGESLHLMFHTESPINLIGGVMMRRDLVGETRFDETLFIGEDFYFIYQNLIKGPSTVFLKQRWYYSLIHDANSSFQYDFSGIYNRFYRRKIVWQSEESLGRYELANCEKWHGVQIYFMCMDRNGPGSDVTKKMRNVMLQERKSLVQTLGFQQKFLFYLSVYMPCMFYQVRKIFKRWKHAKSTRRGADHR